MKVLVTGNLGYIGTVLTPMLLEKGFQVIGMDSDLYRRCTFGQQPIAQVPTMIKDIRDVELEDLRGFDVVMHLAGLSNDPLGDLDPNLTFEINFQASQRLAELSKKAGVQRFIFSSSCSNYGAGGDDFLTESSKFNPVTPYGKSKVMVEEHVSKMASSDFSPVFLRNATAYGVSPRLRFDLVLNNLTAWACTTGKIMLKSDGSPWRPIVHIQDISRAFAAAAKAPRELIHNKAYNVGRTAENYRVRDLALIVSDVIADCKVTFASDASPDKRNYRVNCDQIMHSLKDFRPKWEARLGVRQLGRSFHQSNLTLEDFEGPKYQRISHIRMLLEQGELDNKLRFTRGVTVQPIGQKSVQESQK